MSPPESWPGGGRRHPPRSAATWAILQPLSSWLEAEAARAASGGRRYRVLDVGCGVKPYYPFFERHASEYVGVDLQNPAADLQGTVEEIPVEDGRFDVVLCTQVLEHCLEPDQAVRELRRVTAPGGRVLASTHGVMAYHPSPFDHWRWTHTGLERLFERNAEWASVTVEPGSGTAACVAAMLNFYVHLLAKRTNAWPVARGVIRGLNAVAATVDRRVPSLREPIPGTLFLNYHITAKAPG